MAGLSSDSLETVANLTGLQGTGNSHETPMFYKGLMQLTPALVRTITNVSYCGVDRIPKHGPTILVGNHTSHIDPIVKIMGAKRPVHYLAKAEHFEDKKFQKLMTSTGQIETFRESGGVEALASAVDVLLSGNVMGIFPEGTRTRPGQKPIYKSGFLGIYTESNCSIIPVALNSGHFWPKHSFIKQPGKIIIKILNPIPPKLEKTDVLKKIELVIEDETNKLLKLK